MTSSGKYYDNIIQRLSTFETNVKRSSQLGRTNINKDAERLFCYPLELLFGGQFINLNTVEPNYPAVDLGCMDKRICVQVTSDNEHEKIQSTLNKFFLHGKDAHFDRLIVLIIGERKKYRSSKDTKEVKFPPFELKGRLNFNPDSDIWGTIELLQQIEGLSPEKMEKLSGFLDSQLESTGAMRPYLYLPPRSAVGDGFVGREEELDTIGKQLAGGVKPIVLSGLGGMGKTELAVKFGREYQTGAVYFIHFQGSFENTVRSMFAGVFPQPTQPPKENEQFELVTNLLRRCTEKDLLIIDNVDAGSGTLADLMKDPVYRDLLGMKLRLLLTTRFDWNRVLPVVPLPREELYEIFRTHGAVLEMRQMDDLIDAVNAHTMTIDLIARTLNGKGWRRVTAEDMLRAIRENTLPDEKYRKIATDYNQSREQAQIYQHLSVVFDVSGIPEVGRDVLRCATLLPESGMDGELFGYSLTEQQQDALDELLNHGWLAMEQERIQIHPIIRLVCREELKPSEESCGEFLDALWEKYNEKNYNTDRYSQMAETFAAAAAGDLTERKADWINCAGAIWNKLVQSQKAKALYEKYLPSLEKQFPEHPLLATAYNHTGHCHSDLGENKAAQAFLQKALTIRLAALSSDDPDLALSYNNLGVVCGELGDHNKALELVLKALEIREKALPPDHHDLASSYNNVGSTYGELGDHKKALALNLKALEIRKKVLPPDHPDLASSYNNVGGTYGELGDHVKALEFHLKDLEICEKVLPPDHPDLATSYNNVGGTYGETGDYDQALYYLRKALSICEKKFSVNDKRTHSTRRSIQFYQKQQQMMQNMAKAGFNFANPFASRIPPKK